MTTQAPQKVALVEWFALTIDCAVPVALAEFYAESLGGEVTLRTDEAAFVRAPGISLAFRADPNHRPTTWPAPDVPLHSHFEFVVGDPDTAVPEMLRLGATLAEYQDPDDPNLVVMLDPAGNPFCLIRSSAARRP